MKKFEYKMLEIPSKSIWTGRIDEERLMSQLNELGRQGWEITALSPTMYTSTKERFIILKRETN